MSKNIYCYLVINETMLHLIIFSNLKLNQQIFTRRDKKEDKLYSDLNLQIPNGLTFSLINRDQIFAFFIEQSPIQCTETSFLRT
jgi:uncharacterized membrane protein